MLSPDQIQRIAHLARLELSQAEADDMRQQLNDILAMVDAMSAVDTTGVAPMSHPQEVTQRLRDDRVTETDQRELFQSIAPAVEDGLYLVPKVIE
jgi:aspartyl-tRNA(Asn)/glutamyl-tRNA(Gln) amidotransferase subunit C